MPLLWFKEDFFVKYRNDPNFLLEALAYLGRKASGKTWEYINERIRQRRIEAPASFRDTFSKLTDLTARIDSRLSYNMETLSGLFANLEGLPPNTIGSASPAFLLYYPRLEDYDSRLGPLADSVTQMSPESIACGIARTLDLTDDSSDMDHQTFISLILSQSFPESTKLAIMNIYGSYSRLAQEAAALLEPVMDVMEAEKESVYEILSSFQSVIKEMGCSRFLRSLSHLDPGADSPYLLRPFIFGMDTNLSTDGLHNEVCLYCGILRKELQDMLNIQSVSENSVYEAFHLLGDRTRFDILCYLRGRSAYGQELSSHFRLSRNTIHHHMSKLMDSGLVTCTISGNRVYYSLNKEAILELLDKQRDVFFQSQET